MRRSQSSKSVGREKKKTFLAEKNNKCKVSDARNNWLCSEKPHVWTAGVEGVRKKVPVMRFAYKSCSA